MRATAAQAAWLLGRLERCGCEKWKRIGAACGCDVREGPRAIAAGDEVVAKSARRARVASAEEHGRARMAKAGTVSDCGIAAVRDWIQGLRVDVLARIAEELESWSGSETSVHIPVRLRPELAEMVGGLLEGWLRDRRRRR